MACKAIMVEKEKKDWLKIQRSEWRRDGIRNLKARDPMSNAQQHKKSIGENRHRLLSDVTRRATQKKTSNLSAYLSQRPWSFPSTREVLITYSNLFTSAVPTTSSFYFFLPAQSVVYERTRLNHANLFRLLFGARASSSQNHDRRFPIITSHSIPCYQRRLSNSHGFVIAERYLQEPTNRTDAH
ncbi:hypothetical protein KEM48_005951 [Puccinia striiformis f. sp. tritici PST-130]|nr:hypothetical protein KEM48_005951 [Puccinia striiformis f. sp. tritici PST-130]